jgi:hypothetical protein
MWHVLKTKEVQRGFWWGDLGEIKKLCRYGWRWENNIKIDLQEMGWEYRLGKSGSG